ncbi:MAG: ATP-binding protein [Micromonosporaceae bacterium]|nr:ATP-binding protein [Micromonosporaceae bacterium]
MALAATGTVLVGAAAVVYLLVGPAEPAPTMTVAVMATAAVLSVAVLLIGAIVTIRVVQGRVAQLRFATLQHYQDMQLLSEQLRRGERAYPHTPAVPALDSDQWQLLAHDIDRLRHTAMTALVEAPFVGTFSTPDYRVGVFVNLARRLQSLVHREIQLLDDLEAQVEDPDLLKGLFSVDHLATRIRRHAENLAVLGGAVSRRQWSRPISLYEVLRSAVAEVEQYSRVKLVRPIEGTLQGHAVADVIHLLAELVENATMFSNPQTQVLLRAQRVTAGLAVEVEDRGLGMPPVERHRINSMLAAPEQIDLDELLRDGRIGLFVVAVLGSRHGLAVQLQTNIYGGIQAVLVLPPGLLGTPASDQPEPAEPARQLAASAPVAARPAPALPSRSPAPYSVELPLAGSSPSGQPMVAAATGPTEPVPTTPEAVRPVATTTETMAGDPASPRDHSDLDPRPQLPHRRRQTQVEPPTRDATTGSEPTGGPDPGLIAAFQRGFNRAEAHPGEADAGMEHSSSAT